MSLTIKEEIKEGDEHSIYQEAMDEIDKALSYLDTSKALDVLASYMANSIVLMFDNLKDINDFVDKFAEGIKKIAKIIFEKKNNIQ